MLRVRRARARVVSVARREHPSAFPRDPAGSSATPRRSGRTSCWSCGWRSIRPTCRRRTCARSDRQPARDDRAFGPQHRSAHPRRDQLAGRANRWTVPGVGSRVRAGMFREKTGLPVTTCLGTKIRWLLDHIPGLRERAEAGEVLFGAIDSWLIWNLCGRHVTDVTNASRTLLMNLHTLDSNTRNCSMRSGSQRRCSRRSRHRPRRTGGPARRSRGPRRLGAQRPGARRSSARPTSARARRSPRSGPGASSCSTPAIAPVSSSMGC